NAKTAKSAKKRKAISPLRSSRTLRSRQPVVPIRQGHAAADTPLYRSARGWPRATMVDRSLPMGHDWISVRGARVYNCKTIDVDRPSTNLAVTTGMSGSGKSSLAFDTIYAEGHRRYVESLSAYARQFLEQMEKPDVDLIDGLSPAISIEQKTTGSNPRS